MDPINSWDRYFLEIAKTVSTRGTCPRLKVGAVIVRNRNILSTGYNGSIRGSEHCVDNRCYLVDNHCVRTVHAETNAILQAAKNGTNIDGAFAYVTHSPCINCLKHLLNAGIHCIVWDKQYGSLHPADLLLKLGVNWSRTEHSVSAFYKC
jgi:dCMP deaminase